MHDGAYRIHLGAGQAAIFLAVLALERGRIEVTFLRREDEAVAVAVESVASLEDAVDQHATIRLAECRARFGLAVCTEGSDGIECRRRVSQSQVGETGAHRRRGRDDAVEVVREALRHHHGLAATRGAAYEVRMFIRSSVMLRDDLLCDHGDFGDGLVEKIQRSLLVLKKAAVEHRALVAGVGARHGESARERRTIARVLRAERWRYSAIESAAALKQELPIPVHGKRDCEADSIRLAVAADARIDNPVDAAMRWHCWFRIGRAGGDFACLPDNESVPRHGEFRERRAGLRSIRLGNGDEDQTGHESGKVPECGACDSGAKFLRERSLYLMSVDPRD